MVTRKILVPALVVPLELIGSSELGLTGSGWASGVWGRGKALTIEVIPLN